jgi:hypothetical protein
VWTIIGDDVVGCVGGVTVIVVRGDMCVGVDDDVCYVLLLVVVVYVVRQLVLLLCL